MQLLDVCFGDLVGGMLDDIINATEMVDGLHDIIDARIFRGDAQGVGLEDVARLFLGQATALNMIGIVS